MYRKKLYRKIRLLADSEHKLKNKVIRNKVISPKHPRRIKFNDTSRHDSKRFQFREDYAQYLLPSARFN